MLTTKVKEEKIMKTMRIFRVFALIMLIVAIILGGILLFKQIRCEGGFYRKVLLPVSNASYGMYLIHMIALALFSGWIRSWLGAGEAGVLGIWTTPVQILLTAISCFLTVAILAVLIRKIPRIGKWLMG